MKLGCTMVLSGGEQGAELGPGVWTSNDGIAANAVMGVLCGRGFLCVKGDVLAEATWR